MAGKKSTTENPAETGEAQGDVDSAEQLGAQAAEEAGIERAGVVAATHVKYIGDAHVREITGRDWKAAGIDGQKASVWDNRVRGLNVLPITDFTPEALEYLDRDDAGFVFVDANGKHV